MDLLAATGNRASQQVAERRLHTGGGAALHGLRRRAPGHGRLRPAALNERCGCAAALVRGKKARNGSRPATIGRAGWPAGGLEGGESTTKYQVNSPIDAQRGRTNTVRCSSRQRRPGNRAPACRRAPGLRRATGTRVGRVGASRLLANGHLGNNPRRQGGEGCSLGDGRRAVLDTPVESGRRVCRFGLGPRGPARPAAPLIDVVGEASDSSRQPCLVSISSIDSSAAFCPVAEASTVADAVFPDADLGHAQGRVLDALHEHLHRLLAGQSRVGQMLNEIRGQHLAAQGGVIPAGGGVGEICGPTLACT